MGIEEFMMYYGQQELTKIQKQEMLSMEEENDHAIFAGVDVMDEQDDPSNLNMDHVDIDTLKKKIKEQSSAKKKKNQSILTPGNEDEEVSKSPYVYLLEDDKATVVGIGDVRKALKKNVIEIKTYEEHSSVAPKGMAGKGQKKTVQSAANVVEKQLRAMEKNIESKLQSESGLKKKVISPSGGKLRKGSN